MDGQTKERTLQHILTEDQLNSIISRSTTTGCLLKYGLKPASEEGVTGFLGDHLKLMLLIQEGDLVKKICLFIKSMPLVNVAKAKFIEEYKFYRKESLVYSIFEEMPEDEFSHSSPWGSKAVLYNDSILVLPDLSMDGYKIYPTTKYLDMNHVLVTLTSLARFHAAFANHQTQNESNKLTEKLEYFLKDTQFTDGPWLRPAMKVMADFLKEFSSNFEKYPINLEKFISKSCLDVCDTLREYENTLNVIVHKDLWAHNILFKYAGAEPTNAVLIDFQCARYAPPAIDVMIFLYYTTSNKFRNQHETEVLNHYYSVFSKSIDESTKVRLEKLNYDQQAFLDWCDKARLAGMLVPLAMLPFILLSPVAAQDLFDDTESFNKHVFEDRSAPVLGYARENEAYKTRLFEIYEEFIEQHLDV